MDPPEFVDYFTHSFSHMDLLQCWKYSTKHKSTLENGYRLENATWRKFFQLQHNLPKLDPGKLNWQKESDVIWLYGRFHTYEPLPQLLKRSNTSLHTHRLKPALKKRHEDFLQVLHRLYHQHHTLPSSLVISFSRFTLSQQSKQPSNLDSKYRNLRGEWVSFERRRRPLLLHRCKAKDDLFILFKKQSKLSSESLLGLDEASWAEQLLQHHHHEPPTESNPVLPPLFPIQHPLQYDPVHVSDTYSILPPEMSLSTSTCSNSSFNSNSSCPSLKKQLRFVTLVSSDDAPDSPDTMECSSRSSIDSKSSSRALFHMDSPSRDSSCSSMDSTSNSPCIVSRNLPDSSSIDSLDSIASDTCTVNQAMILPSAVSPCHFSDLMEDHKDLIPSTGVSIWLGETVSKYVNWVQNALLHKA